MPIENEGKTVNEEDLLTLPHLVTLTSFMADNGYTPKEIAYAVEKPWKHIDVLIEARRSLIIIELKNSQY